MSSAAPIFGMAETSGILYAQAGRGQIGAAIVEGDVYLVMQSGDTKRGAGRTVFLLRDADGSLRDRPPCFRGGRIRELEDWKAALTDTETMSRAGRRGMPTIPEIVDRQWRIKKLLEDQRDSAQYDIIRSIAIWMVDSAGTGMNAHYHLRISRPGKYVLFSSWTIVDREYVWWAPITVAAGGAYVKDLDNSVASDNADTCGFRRSSP
jgi:hypothetical protein